MVVKEGGEAADGAPDRRSATADATVDAIAVVVIDESGTE
jgi:hypothetical protein